MASETLEIMTDLPQWQQYDKGTQPGSVPCWSGKAPPPSIGDRVLVRMNGCGPGVVTAYAVHYGFLSLMVKLDEATRPDWHRKQNPNNQAALVFGAEIDALQGE